MSEQAVFNPDGLIQSVNGAAMIRPRSSVSTWPLLAATRAPAAGSGQPCAMRYEGHTFMT